MERRVAEVVFVVAVALAGLLAMACGPRALPPGARAVIVELKLTDADCAPPPDAACLTEIRRVRQIVLDQLEGTPFTVTGAYRNVPFVALRASPAALGVLRESGWVLEIREDGLAVPHSRPR